MAAFFSVVTWSTPGSVPSRVSWIDTIGMMCAPRGLSPVVLRVRDQSVSDQPGRDLDVAVGGTRVRAYEVRRLDQPLGDLTLYAGQADIEADSDSISIAHWAEIHFSVDRCVGRQRDLL